jgi:protein SCO1/2
VLFFASAIRSAIASSTNTDHRCCCSTPQTSTVPSAQLTDKSLYQLDSTWTNDYGAAFKLTSLRGRPQIVTMFFANCAYACPLLVYQMQQIEAALPESLRGKVGFLLVSFDTDRDTPAALHAYRLQHALTVGQWTLLRGSADDVLDLAALLNIKFKRDAQGQFVHSNVITLLNADGEIVSQQNGLDSDRSDLIRSASELARK